MKTAREHFELFPEPYRSLAIAHTDDDKIERYFETPYEALAYSFDWSNTAYGQPVWLDFYKTLLS